MCVVSNTEEMFGKVNGNSRNSVKPKDDTSTSTASMSSTSSNLSQVLFAPKYRTSYQTKASTRPHDAPMKKRDIYFALDCEMVGIGRGAVDSAVARVSIINWDNEIVLDTFVKVDHDVTDYRTYISGIRKEDIDSKSAIPLDEVRNLVQTILRGKILIGHGLQNDLNALGIIHPWCDIRDTATYQPLMKEIYPGMFAPKKLKALAYDVLGWKIQEPGRAHNPVEDATASMEIYKNQRIVWERANTERVKVAAMMAHQQSRIFT